MKKVIEDYVVCEGAILNALANVATQNRDLTISRFEAVQDNLCVSRQGALIGAAFAAELDFDIRRHILLMVGRRMLSATHWVRFSRLSRRTDLM